MSDQILHNRASFRTSFAKTKCAGTRDAFGLQHIIAFQVYQTC